MRGMPERNPIFQVARSDGTKSLDDPAAIEVPSQPEVERVVSVAATAGPNEEQVERGVSGSPPEADIDLTVAPNELASPSALPVKDLEAVFAEFRQNAAEAAGAAATAAFFLEPSDSAMECGNCLGVSMRPTIGMTRRKWAK